jgi:NAD dependent epimerase/dehydratase family
MLMIPAAGVVMTAVLFFLVLPCRVIARSLVAFAPHHHHHHQLVHRRPGTAVVVSFSSGVRKSSSGRKSSSRSSSSSSDTTMESKKKGKLLVLGGTGFLGEHVCKKAVLEGYQVTSLSRRGLPPSSTASAQAEHSSWSKKIDYRSGDARQKDVISKILDDGGDYIGVIHCVGLLFDDASGLGSYNRFVSGSGSLPDADSTYETITRVTAFNAIEAAEDYAAKKRQQSLSGKNNSNKPLPFCFTSAAEAGWPDVPGGAFIEKRLAPDFLQRYLKAKRAVEARLLDPPSSSSSSLSSSSTTTARLLRPIIVRPSLIYSMDRPASYVPVGAFFIGNKLGLPFVDRPVTVQALAAAMIRAMSNDYSDVQGILRYPDIDKLNA